MKLKTLLKLVILSLAFIFFVIFTSNVKAAEGECAKQPCFVPAPTIILPTNNTTTTEARPTIAGLTWKTTNVNIYVDNVLLKDVKIVKHEDYYSSFSVKIANDLKPGKHVIYAFAQDEKNGWGGISKESVHTIINIEKSKKIILTKKIVTKTPIENKFIPKSNKGYEVIGSTTTVDNINKTDEKLVNEAPTVKPAEVPAVKNLNDKKTIFDIIEKNKQSYVEVSREQAEDGVSVTTTASQQLGGGTSELKPSDDEALRPTARSEEIKDGLEIKKVEDYQKRLKTNRIVGFVILAGLALILLIWLLLKEPVFNDKIKTSNDVNDEIIDKTDTKDLN